MAAYNQAIKECMDDTDFHLPTPPSGLTLDDVVDINDEPEKECDDYSEETYNTYLGAELLIPSGTLSYLEGLSSKYKMKMVTQLEGDMQTLSLTCINTKSYLEMVPLLNIQLI